MCDRNEFLSDVELVKWVRDVARRCGEVTQDGTPQGYMGRGSAPSCDSAPPTWRRLSRATSALPGFPQCRDKGWPASSRAAPTDAGSRGSASIATMCKPHCLAPRVRSPNKSRSAIALPESSAPVGPATRRGPKGPFSGSGRTMGSRHGVPLPPPPAFRPARRQAQNESVVHGEQPRAHPARSHPQKNVKHEAEQHDRELALALQIELLDSSPPSTPISDAAIASPSASSPQ